jgi:transcription-repair coupling factor (superfamily II helicase)
LLLHGLVEPDSTWSEALRTLSAALDSRGATRTVRVQGLKGGARAYFLSRALNARPRPSVVVVAGAREAERFAGDLRFFLNESEDASPFARRIHHLPAWDVAPFEDLSPPADVVAARIEALYHLRQSRHPIIVTTPGALVQRVPPAAEFAERYLYLVQGDRIDRDQLAAQLVAWGYRVIGLVEDRGELCLRGGIIDVFPPAHAKPVRILLDGDVIDVMHAFDPVTQRLQAKQDELLILPVREFDPRCDQQRSVLRAIEARALELEVHRRERAALLDGLESGLPFPGVELCLPYFYERLDSFFEYTPPDTVLWIDAPADVEATVERLWMDVERRAREREAQHRFFPPPDSLFLSPRQWREAVAARATVELESLEVLSASGTTLCLPVKSFTVSDLLAKRPHQHREITFAPVAERVRAWRDEGCRVCFVAGAEPQRQRLARLLEAHDIGAATLDAPFEQLLAQPSPAVSILLGTLAEGFRLLDESLVVATEADVFGTSRRRAARAVSIAQLLQNLSELKPDDYIVHLDHGVGIYRGLRHLRVAGTEGDYLHLEYAGGDRLYLPVDRIALVQKYVGADGSVPAVDKLGGTSWARLKHKTRESILAMARELLAVYAAREVHERRGFSGPDPYFREFEAAFPFEETPDQRQAIEDVLADLQQPKPMDRLICGDVGYGKTEVAVRAAFASVLEGRQVAVLVPTTVLAQQHLDTFRRRFDGYPVRVEMLSRFLTPAQSRDVIKGLRDGSVDVVIGTHRLLQADVSFKQLGLLVIDEEHRFGVRHKERIKEMRKLVDVLTLTATPIPRTLHMSLMGIRDLSVIETPPVDRLAIRTYVTTYDEDVIREAVLRELNRGGQVFFVHNRVENIDPMARHLQSLVPEARLEVAHGQMHERDLEAVMLRFIRRETNLLLCSVIIESGLDIPNANTIIINRADQLGLAQLYQLRGRVGRSHERAYAYLLIPGEHRISKDARKRLRVLQELDDLGGGFRLAAHDLEIRGAGNLLGRQQSGHVAAVGFELYTQMLGDAVRELRGERVQVEVEPEIQLGIPAYLPEGYIPDEHQRLAFYRRLANIRSPQEIDEIATELHERFGRIPPLVDSFLRIMDLRRSLKDSMVLSAAMRGGRVNLQFHADASVAVESLVALVHRHPDRFRLSADFQLSFVPRHDDWDGLIQEIQTVLQELRYTPSIQDGWLAQGGEAPVAPQVRG